MAKSRTQYTDGRFAMPDAEDNVEIAPSPNVLITTASVERAN